MDGEVLVEYARPAHQDGEDEKLVRAQGPVSCQPNGKQWRACRSRKTDSPSLRFMYTSSLTPNYQNRPRCSSCSEKKSKRPEAPSEDEYCWIASIPWYDLPGTSTYIEQLWEAIAREVQSRGLQCVSPKVNRKSNCRTQWSMKNLLLSQSCGFDLVASESTIKVRHVATPLFTAKGCAGPKYRSFIIVHKASTFKTLEDLRERKVAINCYFSHSGTNALREIVAPLSIDGRFFSQIIESGSHLESIRMVSEKFADVASIDCITYGLLKQHSPSALSSVKVLCETHPSFAPPFVTRASANDAEVTFLRQILIDVFAAKETRQICKNLAIKGIAENVSGEAYWEQLDVMRTAEEEHKYRELRPAGGYVLTHVAANGDIKL